MDFCPVVSVEAKYGQWRPSYARAWDASFPHSRISLVSFMTTRVRALEDHIAWSSRTSLVTLMSGARVSSSCSCIRHTLAWYSCMALLHTCMRDSRSMLCFMLSFSSFCCSSVSVQQTPYALTYFLFSSRLLCQLTVTTIFLSFPTHAP